MSQILFREVPIVIQNEAHPDKVGEAKAKMRTVVVGTFRSHFRFVTLLRDYLATIHKESRAYSKMYTHMHRITSVPVRWFVSYCTSWFIDIESIRYPHT